MVHMHNSFKLVKVDWSLFFKTSQVGSEVFAVRLQRQLWNQHTAQDIVWSLMQSLAHRYRSLVSVLISFSSSPFIRPYWRPLRAVSVTSTFLLFTCCLNASQPLTACRWNVNKRHGERGQPPNEGHQGTRKNNWRRGKEAQLGIKVRGEDSQEENPSCGVEESC